MYNCTYYTQRNSPYLSLHSVLRGPPSLPFSLFGPRVRNCAPLHSLMCPRISNWARKGWGDFGLCRVLYSTHHPSRERRRRPQLCRLSLAAATILPGALRVLQVFFGRVPRPIGKVGVRTKRLLPRRVSQRVRDFFSLSAHITVAGAQKTHTMEEREGDMYRKFPKAREDKVYSISTFIQRVTKRSN